MTIILTLISLLSFMLGLIGVIVGKIRKKAVKKPLALIGISMVIYVAVAFMLELRPENNESITTRSDNIEEQDNVAGNAEKPDNTEYMGSDIPLVTLTDFSQERAFVQFTDVSKEDLKMAEDGVKATLSDDEDEAAQYAMKYLDYEAQGENRVALIDTKGKVFWKSERTLNSQPLSVVSEFRDGLAYFIFNGNEGESYNIIDLEGNVSYTKECSEGFMILSHGGGLFLVAEHIVNFDVDEWRLGTIDKNGNMVAEYKPYEMTTPSEKPLSVEEPSYPSSEIQDIDDALSRIAEERQAWIEECWDYSGEIDAEYNRMVEETEAEFQNRRNELIERKEKLQEQYESQYEEYHEYQIDLEMYEAESQYPLDTITFDENFAYEYQRWCKYLGEHIFSVPIGSGFAVLNMDSQNVICLNMYSEDEAHIEQFITNFENGSATVLYSEPVDQEALEEEDVNVDWIMLPTSLCSLCRMGTDGMVTPIASNSWTKYVLPHILDGKSGFSDGLLFVPYEDGDDMVYMDKEYYALTRDKKSASERGFILHTGAYYDIDGEVALELSEYNGKREYFCGPFYNGYALMLIQGADQLTYFTVIDKSGKLQFEPRSGFDNVSMSKGGKYLIADKWQNVTVFDIMGNSLVSVNGSEVRLVSSDLYDDSEEDSYDMRDGIIRFKCFYVNVEEGTVIGMDTYGDTNIEFYSTGYQSDTLKSE